MVTDGQLYASQLSLTVTELSHRLGCQDSDAKKRLKAEPRERSGRIPLSTRRKREGELLIANIKKTFPQPTAFSALK